MTHRARWFALIPALTALVLTGPVRPCPAQIVNTLRGFSDEEPGFDGELSLYMDLAQGNTEYQEFSGSLTFQWKGRRQRVRVLSSGRWKTARGEDVANASSGHLRHNWWFAHRWGTIVFVQNQHDRFQRLKSRFLLGGGLRWDLHRSRAFDAFVGMTTMLENEQLEGDGRSEPRRQRMSSFLSLLFDLNDHATFDMVAFYQPRWADFSDFRSSLQARLKTDVVAQLYFELNFSHRYDSRPPEGVKRDDWTLRTGLGMKF